jgi:hypothetical protein
MSDTQSSAAEMLSALGDTKHLTLTARTVWDLLLAARVQVPAMCSETHMQIWLNTLTTSFIVLVTALGVLWPRSNYFKRASYCDEA